MSWYRFGLVFSLCHAIANNFSSPFSARNIGKGLNYFCMNLRKEKKNSGMAEDGEGKKRRKMEKENKNEGIRKKERAEIQICKNRVPRGGSNPP